MEQAQLIITVEIRERFNLPIGTHISYDLFEDMMIGRYAQVKIAPNDSRKRDHYLISTKGQITVPKKVLQHLGCEGHQVLMVVDKLIENEIILVKDYSLQIHDEIVNIGLPLLEDNELSKVVVYLADNYPATDGWFKVDHSVFDRLVNYYNRLKQVFSLDAETEYFIPKLGISIGYNPKAWNAKNSGNDLERYIVFKKIGPNYLKNGRVKSLLLKREDFILDRDYVTYWNNQMGEFGELIMMEAREPVQKGTSQEILEYFINNARLFQAIKKNGTRMERIILHKTGDFVDYDPLKRDSAPIYFVPAINY